MSATTQGVRFQERLRAAVYVRMSTERQSYSIANQLDRIKTYAAEHEMDIVAVYEDAGKSGLTFHGRPGLIRLIADVQTQHDFTVLLVYDVSRWGRFQDLDESAHYEHLCKSNGVSVAYCAESFVNDDSLYAAIAKVLKRAAAAEYSRDLSAKVFAGQCRLVRMGYKAGGGAPAYGLRRALLDADGSGLTILTKGQWKVIQTQHVILVPGPEEEIWIVNQIFKWYAEDGIGDRKIAAVLNAQQVPTGYGTPWTPDIIRGLLRNEKYIGNLVFNKLSFKLKRRAVRNPPYEWVRCDGALPAIVPKQLFMAVQRERDRRYRRYTKDELITMLQRIHKENGRISSGLIDRDPDSPKAALIARHFGTLFDALIAAGLTPNITNDFLISRSRNYGFREQILKEMMTLAAAAGGQAERCALPHALLLNGAVSVSVRVIRCCLDYKWNYYRWRVPKRLIDGHNFLLIATLDRSNQFITSYLLFSASDFDSGNIAFTEKSIARYAVNQRNRLDEFFISS
jgi:DNA invertase Pin-like site-specific DNA recombinase